MRNLVAIFKAFFLVFITLLVLVTQVFVFLIPSFRTRYIWVIPRLWHKAAAKATGIKIIKTGTDYAATHPQAGMIYAANHSSYLDIVTLGAFVKGVFVAKSEIASWPVFGFLAKLQGTYFVVRHRSEAEKQRTHLRKMILKGMRIIIFPEGTTTNGFTLYPFKPSLFGSIIADELNDKTIMVQPITLAYVKYNKKDITTQAEMDNVAWYRDDHDLMPHLWDFLKSRGVTVKIHFGNAFRVSATDERKAIAARLESDVRDHFAQMQPRALIAGPAPQSEPVKSL